MIPVDLFYKTLLTNANSDIRGNITPTELTLILNDKVNEIYEEYFSDKTRMLNRQNRGLMAGGTANIPDRIDEKINHFLTEATMVYAAPIFTLPADHRWTDAIFYDTINEVEMCATTKKFNLLSNFIHTKPTTTTPIGLKTGGGIKIAPSTIVNNITISYLRNPLIGKWTFQVVSGAELYNPSAGDHQDIDLHPSEFNNLVIRVLQGFGQNLKETDLQNVTQNEKTMDFNNENQS